MHFCREKTFNPLTSKNKQFYRLLVSVKVKPSKGFIKLKEDFDLNDSTAANASLTVKSYSSETFIRSFQLKLLADITFTNHYLTKIGYVSNDLCTFCEEGSETVDLLLYECSLSLSPSYRFWKQFVGESDQLLNYPFILAIICNCHKRRVVPQIWTFLR